MSVDDLLARARERLLRVTPEQAAQAAAGDALLVDIRPEAQRRDEGEIPGALLMERNVLEWRLDPTSAWRVPELSGARQVVILICSQGYASSLAAATLQDLGLAHATDVIGGFQAWLAAGLPVSRAV